MKRFLVIIFIAWSQILLAQETDYYRYDTAQGKYAAYNVKHSDFVIHIENKKNKGVSNIRYYDENGDVIYDINRLGTLVTLINPEAFYDAVRKVFTSAELAEFNEDYKKNGDLLFDDFTFDFSVMANKAGKIEELTIEFPDIPSTRKINPDKFEELETILRTTVRYEYPAERLKALQYLFTKPFSVFGKKW